MTDYRDLDRRAVLGSAEVARAVTAAQFDAPTPCAGWSVLNLMEHMTVQHHGFAAAARGTGADPSIWLPVPLGDDPVAAYLAACDDVIAAFAEPGSSERMFDLPEISTEIAFPAALAMSFHFVDYVVHGWDLAAAIGAPYRPDDDVLAAAFDVAQQVPAGDARVQPGAAFAPVLEVDSGATLLDQVLSLLGRPPGWSAG